MQIPGSAKSGTNINNIYNTTTTEVSNVVLFTIGAPPGTPPAITSVVGDHNFGCLQPLLQLAGFYFDRERHKFHERFARELEWSGATEKHHDIYPYFAYGFGPSYGRRLPWHCFGDGNKFDWHIFLIALHSFHSDQRSAHTHACIALANVRCRGQFRADADCDRHKYSAVFRCAVGKPQQCDNAAGDHLYQRNATERHGPDCRFPCGGNRSSRSAHPGAGWWDFWRHPLHYLGPCSHFIVVLDDAVVWHLGNHDYRERDEFREWFGGRLDYTGDAIDTGNHIGVGDNVCQFNYAHCNRSRFVYRF